MASWETMQMAEIVDAHAFVVITKREVYLNVRYGVDGPGMESLKKGNRFLYLKKTSNLFREPIQPAI
jgi:hypothetical protein